MISVAMTTYNGARFVESQLLSILHQTQQVDEIIICDDVSRDDTVEIINRIVDKTGVKHVSLIQNKKNLGYVDNFYKAIGLTHGDYIFLADQDDIWHSDKIEKSMKVMKETNAAAICTKSRLIDGMGNPLPDGHFIISVLLSQMTERLRRVSFFDLVIENVAQGCTYCFTKEVKERYLRVNSANLIHDHQILFVASLTGAVYAYNEALIDYRIHGNNSAGLQKVDKNLKVRWKKPDKKPVRVRFLEDLGSSMHVPHLTWYKLMYYLRLPYFISVFRRRRQARKNG